MNIGRGQTSFITVLLLVPLWMALFSLNNASSLHASSVEALMASNRCTFNKDDDALEFNIDISGLEEIEIANIPGRLEITGDTGTDHIKISNVKDLMFNELCFGGDGSTIQISDCYLVHMTNSMFVDTSMISKSKKLLIEGGSFELCAFQLFAENTTVLSNSTYQNSKVDILEISHVEVTNCSFTNSTLYIYYFDELYVLNNRFVGRSSGLILWPQAEVSYIPHPPKEIIGNVFESNDIGIDLWKDPILGYQPYYNYTICDNYWGNCSIAFNSDKSKFYSFHIFRNIFYHNKGTGNADSGTQISTEISLYDGTIFYQNEIGNCWWNHRAPDDDDNGIVDVHFDVQNRGGYLYDEFPLTDRFEKIFRPRLRILEPSGYEHYKNITVKWNITQLKYNITSLELRFDQGDWIDVIDSNSYQAFLDRGNHTVHLKAENEVRLQNSTSMDFTIGYDPSYLNLISPIKGSYQTNKTVNIVWAIKDDFPISSIFLQVDDYSLKLQKGTRAITLELYEAKFELILRITDPLNLSLEARIDFIVDLTPPLINILSPYSDVVFSNPLMNFVWSVHDDYGIQRARYRIDEESWESFGDQGDFSFQELLGKGDHIFEVEAHDIAGWSTLKKVPFSIGTGSLKIIEPSDGFVTRNESIELKWVISSDFHPEYFEILDIMEGILLGTTSDVTYRAPLSSKDKNWFMVRSFDDIGNSVSDDVIIFKDQKPPVVEVLNEEQYVNDDPLNFLWFASDPHGIRGYRWRIDSGTWHDISNVTTLRLTKDMLQEGFRKFTIECIDMAGNTANDEYDFLYDMTPPKVQFIDGEQPLFLKEPFLSLSWIMKDDNGLSNSTLMMGERKYEMSPNIKSWDGIADEGYSTVEILVRDLAGNWANDSIVVLVDTIDPTLEWTTLELNLTNLWEFLIGWNSWDNNCIYIQLLDEGVMIMSSPMYGENWVILRPSEGIHIYTVVATDLVGRMASISRRIVVDHTPPMICTLDRSVSASGIELQWTSMDNLSSVAKVNISIDEDISYEFNGPNGTCLIGGLALGPHKVKIRFTDEAGNFILWESEISVPGTNGDDNGHRTLIWICVLFLILLGTLAASVISLILMIRSKKAILPKGLLQEEIGPL